MIKNSYILQSEMNTQEPYTALNGEYVLSLSDAKIYFTDGKFTRNFISVNTGDKIIDGSAASITVKIDKDPGSGISVFNIAENMKDLTFRNIKLNIRYKGGMTGNTVYGFKNHSYRLTVKDCKIDFLAENQINYTAIHNDGKLDTHLGTPADCLTVFGNHITANQTAQEISKESVFCGIDNVSANSVSISNNYIFIKNTGSSEDQQAIGVRNSGWHMRLENNNIKGNGSHISGNLLEQAHAYGVYNIGNYMIFTGNNCVGEWGGKCVGLYNSGMYANITGNKILATHTIMGRSVVIKAERNILSGNIITNTSRNPHFVEVLSRSNIITNNYIQGLMFMKDLKSGCGIFIAGEESKKIEGCNISNNIFGDIKDFGIVLINTQRNIIQGNHLAMANGAETYTAIYAKSQDDIISDNVTNENTGASDAELADKLYRNYDQAVCSLV